VERTRRPRRAPAVAAAAAVSLLASLLAGCSASFNATAVKPYAPADGIYAVSGDIRVLNALVVAGDGGRTGVVSMTVANTGDQDDRLTGLTSPTGTVQLSGDTTLPAGGAVRFGSDTEASATISGMTRLAGESIRLRLTFARTQPITIDTVVVPATGDYAELTPSASPTPTE
jgi:copper(I)-binding protein